MDPKCRICNVGLNDENWYPASRDHTCKECGKDRSRLWRMAHPEQVRAYSEKVRRKQGTKSFNENTACPSFLGVHIAERVLSHVFKNVKRMPYGNSGYDFICNYGKMVDAKCSCIRKDGSWMFAIRRNTVADFFICLAFDNREDLNPLHAWLIPGSKFSHRVGVGISPSTIHKWDEYRIDLSKVSACCDEMRGD